MKEDQERVRALLTDTVTLLCRNGLSFQRKLRVQGLIGITIDDDEVFIVQINEILSAGSTVDDASSNTIGSTVDNADSNTINQSRTKVPQLRNSVERLSPERTVSEISENSAVSAKFSIIAKNDVDECAAISNEDLPSIVMIKPEPDEVIVVDEPSVKMARREQHFRKYFKKPFDKRNKFSDFYINSRRGKSDLYTNRMRRLASVNAAGVPQIDFSNIDNNFSRTVPSDNEQDAGYSNMSDSFNSSFVENSSICLENGLPDWDYRRPDPENSLERNLADLSTDQIIHTSSSSGYMHSSAYPSSRITSSWLPISRRPVDSTAKQFVCDYEGCTLAYYERKNLLQHQSLKHGRPSLRSHMKRRYWSPPDQNQ